MNLNKNEAFQNSKYKISFTPKELTDESLEKIKKMFPALRDVAMIRGKLSTTVADLEKFINEIKKSGYENMDVPLIINNLYHVSPVMIYKREKEIFALSLEGEIESHESKYLIENLGRETTLLRPSNIAVKTHDIYNTHTSTTLTYNESIELKSQSTSNGCAISALMTINRGAKPKNGLAAFVLTQVAEERKQGNRSNNYSNIILPIQMAKAFENEIFIIFATYAFREKLVLGTSEFQKAKDEMRLNVSKCHKNGIVIGSIWDTFTDDSGNEGKRKLKHGINLKFLTFQENIERAISSDKPRFKMNPSEKTEFLQKLCLMTHDIEVSLNEEIKTNVAFRS